MFLYLFKGANLLTPSAFPFSKVVLMAKGRELRDKSTVPRKLKIGAVA